VAGNSIFVFGSNLAGRHGRGAARYAAKNYGAIPGCGIGRQGNAYAIPTKGRQLEVLPLEVIRWHVNDFLVYARNNPELTFHLTAIGCGLAGYKPKQIEPMFRQAPENVILPTEFEEIHK
jgi:hypothetical protein